MELDIDRGREGDRGRGALTSSPGPSVRRKAMASWGFCMGGALAQFAATNDEKVGSAVSFYGGFKKGAPPLGES